MAIIGPNGVPPTEPPAPAGFHLHLADIVSKVIAVCSALIAAGVIPNSSTVYRVLAAIVAAGTALINAGVLAAKAKVSQ